MLARGFSCHRRIDLGLSERSFQGYHRSPVRVGEFVAPAVHCLAFLYGQTPQGAPCLKDHPPGVGECNAAVDGNGGHQVVAPDRYELPVLWQGVLSWESDTC